MREVVIATKNPDKRKELKRLLRGLKIKVTSLDKYPGCPQVREGSRCFRENAIRKARSASRFTKRIALADDSGLETDALGGRPGIRSSRFAGSGATYAKNNRKLLKLLQGKQGRQRGAQFRCAVAVYDYPKLVGVAEGRIRGRIAECPRGRAGFGYDPLFIVPKYKKTFAQLSPGIKNQISHRARALKKAKKLIFNYLAHRGTLKGPHRE
jgi:XTP/dITP diphosphohydrolase